MEGKRVEKSQIRKGPWNARKRPSANQPCQDVRPPRLELHSIQGLLQRTGKSCRLRWVTNLDPLEEWCKFTADEERVVIELQAQFGNKLLDHKLDPLWEPKPKPKLN
ncbi:hypothetical protein F3Y22_tig00110481pilonHSYRG00016 [Hibiscus syriacus]|uniref:HTH myb-type domain-containing protein n=1 Tax=Hibiscus syriacus TaxID=106335 RepID=A0A6A3AFF5_HIBSY|nr:hypothetical protein F3Y22_tig00110481pilonHSYRG00016 [Hibiscus syriacus]